MNRYIRPILALFLFAVLLFASALGGWVANSIPGRWPGGEINWANQSAGIPGGLGAGAWSLAVRTAGETWNDDRGSDLHWMFRGLDPINVITTGANGIRDTGAADPDDHEVVPRDATGPILPGNGAVMPGNGQPNTTVIDTGANGVAETAPAAGDAVIIPVGQGFPMSLCLVLVGGAPPAPGGDDIAIPMVVPGVGTFGQVNSGVNGICETPAGGAVVAIPMGQGLPNAPSVSSGADGVADTTAAGDDVQRIEKDKGEPNVPVITAGTDGILQTAFAVDDLGVRSDCSNT
ncbi:MAG: hypothetical protein GY778_29525, partial [bacterium]|nr:hypothetical protein [bacterium]